MKLTYPACFYPCEEKPGAYTVEVPDLPGCVSQGDTLADAILMGTDAASGWVLDELEDGRPAPAASPLEKVVPDEGGFVNMLVLDMDALSPEDDGTQRTAALTAASGAEHLVLHTGVNGSFER